MTPLSERLANPPTVASGEVYSCILRCPAGSTPFQAFSADHYRLQPGFDLWWGFLDCRSSKLNPDLQMLAKLKSLLPATWPERINKYISGTTPRQLHAFPVHHVCMLVYPVMLQVSTLSCIRGGRNLGRLGNFTAQIFMSCRFRFGPHSGGRSDRGVARSSTVAIR